MTASLLTLLTICLSPSGVPEELIAREQAAIKKTREQLKKIAPEIKEIVFVRRFTYSANHYYTEYINSRWTPGGNLCVLSLETGEVRDLVPQLKDGVFGRFDVSFDAKRVVFGYKASNDTGYRIYEVGVDGKGFRQITFPPADESEIVKKYQNGYHHGTDDMHPCYLADGGIAFISTRCQYGILCDSPDIFTTTVLYRMDADGGNIRKLTNSSVSEASPVMLPDGRLMYTRWEYLDKGAVSVKCLWAMRPDGSGSHEIYAADIALPPTFIYGRAIPDAANKYVVLGTPHCPQNGIGTVIRLDMNSGDMRTREPMTYITPLVDIQAEPGFSFRADLESNWQRDGSGSGPLYKDPYPLSEKHYLVAHKPRGFGEWKDPKGYGLYLLTEGGQSDLIYRDPEISCWQPYPLVPRKTPPVLTGSYDDRLAKKDMAACLITDVYHGMEGVDRGEVKYIRVIEQVPRPWSARRRWGGDVYDQQHPCISKDTHLGLKVLHGVTPVEEDGSAYFKVPADKNISLQLLDENYMAVQTERTYVNYRPGEVRGCIGCHESSGEGPTWNPAGMLALKSGLRSLDPQPGDATATRPLHFPTDVQPVLDRHCTNCHGDKDPEAGMDLTGRMTRFFSASYENLIKERRGGRKDRREPGLVPTIGENHPKTGNVHYLPPKSLGSHASLLMALLSKGKIELADPAKRERLAELMKVHKGVKLEPEEFIRIATWVDTNAQYYGSYFGRRDVQYAEHPNFRPVPTVESALGIPPLPEDER